ncbi:hypothetical protein ACQEVZ_02655 [Dactylosporangium sp. CA-152071]|uniref:hypothetical protein n=1 Tax=Dactylosporangium sp. CA-152071 TaxID=3239933 RepID=UPI003D934153
MYSGGSLRWFCRHPYEPAAQNSVLPTHAPLSMPGTRPQAAEAIDDNLGQPDQMVPADIVESHIEAVRGRGRQQVRHRPLVIVGAQLRDQPLDLLDR